MWAMADRERARMVGELPTGRREACERGSGGFGVDQLWLAF